MSDLQYECRVGHNSVENKFEVQLLVSNGDSLEEAKALAAAFKERFKSFVASHGGTSRDGVSSTSGTRSGLILPH